MDSIDWVAERVDTLEDLLNAATVLLAVLLVATAYYRTRSLVAVLVAGVVAGAVLWMINNVGWWQQKAREEVDGSAAPIVTETVTGLVPRPLAVVVVGSAVGQEHHADNRL